MKDSETLIRVRELKKYFPIQEGFLRQQTGNVKAVDGITFDIRRGETLSLVGESGCGKSTAGRTILQLHKPTSGEVWFEGKDLATLRGEPLRKMRRKMQLIFQDPYASLSPRMKVGRIIAEPLKVHGISSGETRNARVEELLEIVGLNSGSGSRYPHEFSGGQRQRVGIARALALNPSFIICDEPISALDVSIQAQIVNLLKELQNKLGVTYLFIAHDLSMVRYISDRVAVMYLGNLMELAPQQELFKNPLHPYTQALLSAVPVPDPAVEETRQRVILEGELPNPANPPKGCNFNSRCPIAVERCFQETPSWREAQPGHWIACHEV